jgi:hypothetical protein
MSAPDPLRALALALLPHLRELGAIGPVAGAVVYDRDNLPTSHRSPEAFAGECRRLGLDRVLYREARSWRVPRDVWERARAEDRARRAAPRPAPEADAIDSQLQKAGLRLVQRRA